MRLHPSSSYILDHPFHLHIFTRWEVVAEYINQHTATNITRQAKEVLNKAKELQHSDQHMREAANKNAYHSMEKAQARQVISDATASQRYDS